MDVQKAHEKCSTSLIIREMQIKLQWGITSHRLEWPSLKSLQITNAGEDVGKGNTPPLLVGMLIGIAIMENSMKVPLKTRIRTTIWSSNPPPGHIPRENHSQEDTCTWTFTAAPFTIIKAKNQTKRPLTKEWIGEHTHTHTQEYYLDIKNEIISSAAIRMDLEIIILIEVSLRERKIYDIHM